MLNLESRGRLIVFEGTDGSGKTTLAHKLTEWLIARGVKAEYHAFPGAENGTLGRHVYDLHHTPFETAGISSIHPTSVQLLHIAAHVEAIESRIRPALAEGRWIVLDRFWWSTWVYGVTGGVPEAALEAMIAVERLYWVDDQPAATFLVQRRTPLRAEPMEQWKALGQAYESLARREALQMPVHAVANDGSVENGFSLVIERIEFLLSPVSTA